MAFGVTDEGFVPKRLQDILEETRSIASAIFGDLVAPGDAVDTTDSSALGRMINLDAEGDEELWEAAQQAYSAFDPNSATGIALDNLVAYGGLFRFAESSSIVPLILKGDFNINIAAGSFVESPTTSVRFSTEDPVTLDLIDAIGLDVKVAVVANATLYSIQYTSAANGTDIVEYTSDADATEEEIIAGLDNEITINHPLLLSATPDAVTLQIFVADAFQLTTFVLTANLFPDKSVKIVDSSATEPGPQVALAGTITQIVTPILGWDSVTNPVAAATGRLAETDEELRLRFANTKFTQGSNTVDAIFSDVLQLNGVTQVIVLENDEDLVDANGIPGHSFLTLVTGGIQQEIAEAIYENKPVGILAFGNIAIPVLDSQGIAHEISFSRPTLIGIVVEMALVTNGAFPLDGQEQIEQAIIAYAAEALKIGDDVILSQLYTPINSVPGHSVTSLQIGYAPGPLGGTNLPIDFDETASFAPGDITFI